jgi:hypothetical protein
MLGVPGLADLISLAWNGAEGTLEKVTPPELVNIISMVSLAVFFITLYLNLEIFLRGAKNGRRGLDTVGAGIIFGAFIGLGLPMLAREFLA